MKDLTDDTQMRVISSMEPEICTKIPSYSMVKIASLKNVFTETFELEAKGEKIKSEKKFQNLKSIMTY